MGPFQSPPTGADRWERLQETVLESGGEALQRPVVPELTARANPPGYGGSAPLQSRALERGGAAARRNGDAGAPPGLSVPEEITARVIVDYDGGQGYAARLEGCQRWGETDSNELACTRALEGEGVLSPRGDSLPVWLGIETAAGRPAVRSESNSDSHSEGSLEFYSRLDEKTCCTSDPF